MSLGIISSIAAVVVGSWFFLLAVSNAVFFRISRVSHYKKEGPFVSILIPARNEEKRLDVVLTGLEKQTYTNFEVLVIDDNSTDGTWALLEKAALKNKKMKILKGAALPDGWKGKPFAMVQLAQAARGEIFFFIDADMEPGEDLIAWAVDGLTRNQADSLSGYARHRAKSKKEYFFFPLMYLVNMGFLPFWLIKTTKTPLFSHAIGQIMAFKRSSYEAAGGFERVKNEILEDIQMGRAMKAAGFRHVFLDAKNVLSGNMYDSWEHLLLGLERTIFEYFDKKLYPMIILTFFIFFFMVAPPFITAAGFLFGWPGSWGWLASSLLTLLGWTITMIDRRVPFYVAFIYPVQFFFTLVMSWKSLISSVTGRGYLWKDRQVV